MPRGFLLALLLVASAVRLSAQQAPASPATHRALSTDASDRVAPVAWPAAALAGPRTERLPDGRARRLVGPLPLAGRDLDERLADALLRHAPAFGLDAGVELVEAARRPRPGDGAWVGYQQRVHGAAVDGHGLVLRLDHDGALAVMHGALLAGASALAPPAVDDAAALAIARRALEDAGLATPGDELPATLTSAVRVRSDGPRLVRRVSIVAGLLPWRIDVDALDGTPLPIEAATSHGGTVQSGGETIDFDTGPGRGRAYRSVAHALASRASGVTLPELTREDAVWGMVEQHSLSGRYTSVSSADGWRLHTELHGTRFEPLSFLTLGPQRSEHQLFDQVNAYAWITRAAAEYECQPDGPRLLRSVRAYVDFDAMGQGYANAYYSPADPDGPAGQPPGFLVFGEFSGLTGDPRDDLSRDPSVVAHEVDHLVLHEAGLAFGDAPPHTPPRGLSEGLADFAAAHLLDDPRVGAVLVAHGEELSLTGEALRDVSQPLHLPTRLWDSVHAGSGLPEEHHLGRLVASTLWHLRGTLGARRTARLVRASLIDLPQHTAEVGVPVVTQENATAATRAYLAACGLALLDRATADDAPVRGAAGPLLGALLTAGWLGDGLAPAAPLLVGAAGLRCTIPGAFVDGVTEQRLAVTLQPGQRLSIDLAGSPGTTVDFDWSAHHESPDALLASQPKTQSPSARRARQRGVLALEPVTVLLRLRDPSGAGGRYRLRLRVRPA